jgi:hypothetical protein
MKNPKKKIFNPFEGRDREQVWKEIREKAQPVSKDEAIRKMKEASIKQQKGK